MFKFELFIDDFLLKEIIELRNFMTVIKKMDYILK
jgi:hypothetical protein